MDANKPDTAQIEKPDQDEAIFVLQDVVVETLGLVEQGAVDETFFLLKSEGSMEEDGLEELAELTSLEKLGIERATELIERGLAAEEAEAIKAKTRSKMEGDLSAGAMRGVRSLLDSYGDELPDEIMGMLVSLLEDGESMTGEGDKTKTQKSSEVDKMSDDQEKVIATQPPEAEAPAEASAAEVVTKDVAGPQIDELTLRLEKAEASHQATVSRLEKAEAELQKAREMARQEREARERIAYIDKASEFDALGVNPDEMGTFLHKLAQIDEGANLEKAADAADRSRMFEYIEAVLKAANEQISEAGFYKEAGSSKVPTGTASLEERALAKVASGEYPDLRTALMSTRPDEAQAYLAKFEN